MVPTWVGKQNTPKMAPRKAAAGEAEGRCPILKLTIEKGPLSGQINEFRPGSRIQVGRVVRGNTLSIKEDGISSKHLLIQADSSSEHWTITDLGSSNGTILNGELLNPSESVVLSDGDEIKIGEMTSMRVTFEIGRAAAESNGGNVRKNTRRRSRNQGGELGVIPENTELGLGLGRENGDLVNEGVKLGTVGEGKVRVWRSQRSKAIVVEEEGETFQRKKGNLKVKDLVDDEENTENESVVEGKGGKYVSVRRARGSRKDGISTDLSVIEQKVSVRRTRKSNMEANTEVSEIKLANNEEKSEKVSVRRTRCSIDEEEMVDLGVTEGQSKNKGGVGKTKISAEKTALEEEKEEQVNVECEICEGQRNSAALDNVSLDDGDETGREGAAGMAGGTFENKKGQLSTDLETMTLGEWFNFLEDYLPKQIIEATEELISDMNQKAKRLHEYKLQTMNAKEKGREVVE